MRVCDEVWKEVGIEGKTLRHHLFAQTPTTRPDLGTMSGGGRDNFADLEGLYGDLSSAPVQSVPEESYYGTVDDPAPQPQQHNQEDSAFPSYGRGSAGAPLVLESQGDTSESYYGTVDAPVLSQRPDFVGYGKSADGTTLLPPTQNYDSARMSESGFAAAPPASIPPNDSEDEQTANELEEEEQRQRGHQEWSLSDGAVPDLPSATEAFTSADQLQSGKYDDLLGGEGLYGDVIPFAQTTPAATAPAPVLALSPGISVHQNQAVNKFDDLMEEGLYGDSVPFNSVSLLPQSKAAPPLTALVVEDEYPVNEAVAPSSRVLQLPSLHPFGTNDESEVFSAVIDEPVVDPGTASFSRLILGGTTGGEENTDPDFGAFGETEDSDVDALFLKAEEAANSREEGGVQSQVRIPPPPSERSPTPLGFGDEEDEPIPPPPSVAPPSKAAAPPTSIPPLSSAAPVNVSVASQPSELEPPRQLSQIQLIQLRLKEQQKQGFQKPSGAVSVMNALHVTTQQQKVLAQPSIDDAPPPPQKTSPRTPIAAPAQQDDSLYDVLPPAVAGAQQASQAHAAPVVAAAGADNFYTNLPQANMPQASQQESYMNMNLGTTNYPTGPAPSLPSKSYPGASAGSGAPSLPSRGGKPKKADDNEFGFGDVTDYQIFHHGAIDREEAERRLQGSGFGPGAYLLRSKGTDTVMSCISTNRIVHNVLSFMKDGRYYFEGLFCGTAFNESMDFLAKKMRQKPTNGVMPPQPNLGAQPHGSSSINRGGSMRFPVTSPPQQLSSFERAQSVRGPQPHSTFGMPSATPPQSAAPQLPPARGGQQGAPQLPPARGAFQPASGPAPLLPPPRAGGQWEPPKPSPAPSPTIARQMALQQAQQASQNRPHTTFFHGDITREESEQRLYASGFGPGAYLLRAKDRDTVLCCLFPDKVAHNVLTYSAGVYSFEGLMCGSTLNEAVDKLGMKMKQTPKFGVLPPAGISRGATIKSRQNSVSERHNQDGDASAMQPGGAMWNRQSGARGSMSVPPKSTSVNMLAKPTSMYSHGNISRDEAERRLATSTFGAGAYLIREKEGEFILCCMTGSNKVIHNIITYRNNRLVYKDKDFGTDLDQAIQKTIPYLKYPPKYGVVPPKFGRGSMYLPPSQ